ncbi:tyrosine-protein phosphatase 1-like [Planococcus citri]|uniref:tyrosine-protein phosphatase 1-like n=1 Tax=Planococcus citri TaxID=170843 RepID=UPI0031F9EBC1
MVLTREQNCCVFSHFTISNSKSYVDDDTADSLTERSHRDPGSLYNTPNYENPFPQVEENIVYIKLTPDRPGRFGFNVKGALDLNMEILMSRVAPNTPADRCYPKLNEVLMINECSVSGLERYQVVKLSATKSRMNSLCASPMVKKRLHINMYLSHLYLRCKEKLERWSSQCFYWSMAGRVDLCWCSSNNCIN